MIKTEIFYFGTEYDRDMAYKYFTFENIYPLSKFDLDKKIFCIEIDFKSITALVNFLDKIPNTIKQSLIKKENVTLNEAILIDIRKV